MPTGIGLGKRKGDPAPEGYESSDLSDGYESDPEFEVELMGKLLAKVNKYKVELGMGHWKTLRKVFRLLNLYIQHYMLDKMDDLLLEFADTCKGKEMYGSTYYIKYIQMLGFCRWKQHRLREALALFHEQEHIIGDNEILCENIGHTYSSLGDYQSAIGSFQKGLHLLGNSGLPGRKAGFLYGIALAKDRLGQTEESIPLLREALDGYRKERIDPQGNPIDSSIHAKVEMSLGHMHEKLGSLDEAAKYMAEAVRVFRKCVGDGNPLTHGALGALGDVKIAQKKFHEALPLYTEALTGEANKDAFQVDTVFKLLNSIKSILTEHPPPRAQGSAGESNLSMIGKLFRPYLPVCRRIVNRCKPLVKSHKMGDAAATFKTIGEMYVLAGEYTGAVDLLNSAITIFGQVKQVDCTVSVVYKIVYLNHNKQSTLN